MAVAGPQARAVLSGLVDEDLSNAAFPHLAARAVTLMGGRLPGRLFRISFSGELAYELAVPAGYGESVADANAVIRKVLQSRPGQRIEMEVVHWAGGRSRVTIVLGDQSSTDRRR